MVPVRQVLRRPDRPRHRSRTPGRRSGPAQPHPRLRSGLRHRRMSRRRGTGARLGRQAHRRPPFLPGGRRTQGVEGSSLRATETHLRPDVEHQPLDHIPGSAKGINRPPDWASRERGARAVHPSSLERVTLVSLLFGDQFYESARPDGCGIQPPNLGPLGLLGPPLWPPPPDHLARDGWGGRNLWQKLTRPTPCWARTQGDTFPDLG